MESDLLKTSIGGLVRHLITTVGGSLVAGGYIGDSDVTALVGAGMAIFGVVWSVAQKQVASKAAAAKE